MQPIIVLLLGLLLSVPITAMASQFTCSIKSVMRVGDDGLLEAHPRENLYLNRQFTVDRASGRIIRSTALHARLRNMDKTHHPQVVNQGSASVPYTAITVFKDTGVFTALHIDTDVKAADKPFYYMTRLGMLLTGTCAEDR
jgi:hypothetical protein